jgi:hypothetical protein
VPLTLGPDEARAYLQTHEAPAPHLDLLAAAGFRAVGAALRLGVVDALAAGPLDRDRLAAAVRADPRGVELLADLLVSLGYLVREGEAYANGPAAERWLRGPYAPAVSLWQHLLFELWGDLETSLREGKPAVDFYSWLDGHPAARRDFEQVQAGQAARLAEEVLDLVPVPAGATGLLDVGGGHAAYAVAFCRRHPRLRATVLDLPGALAAGREAVEAAGLADRVTLRPGDWAEADLAGPYDLALVFNVVHGNSPEQNAALLGRVAGAVRPGGVVALLEQLADPAAPSQVDDAFVRAFSLNLFHTQGGRVYRRAEIGDWLAGAGLAAPRWSSLRRMPANHLAVAVRPGEPA